MARTPVTLESLLPPGVDAPARAGELMVSGLQLDSRKVGPGDVFAALPGVRTDGRNFIADAQKQGAVAILAPKATQTIAPLIGADDPREALAAMAAKLHPRQPGTMAAVTGTNGKSSTVEFLRQIWAADGLEAAALGTLGVTRSDGAVSVGYTTPDAIALHQALDRLAGEGVTHLAMEASSHGLKQRRMDAAAVSLVGFTNLTQDHLDYHPDFDDYFASKMRLFDVLAPDGAPAVVNVDSEWGGKVADGARKAGLTVDEIGWRGRTLKIEEITPRPASQSVRFTWNGEPVEAELPLIGEFQTLNALGAAALAIRSGVSPQTAFVALERLAGVPGRLELAGKTNADAPVLIDYAHTPDGLDKLLRAARPHTQGRVIVVFGAGGDRDPNKREKMGRVAAKLADHVIVTDDNPRSEDPAAIRRAVLEGCPDAAEIADRRAAIGEAVAMLREGDALLIAGKGHETGQIFADRTEPFDDREEARAALRAQGAAS